MARLNHLFSKLSQSYLFPEIEKRIAAFQNAHPDSRPLLDLGLGDVTEPIAPSIIAALCKASLEMGQLNSFRGYGPSEGYPFLREAIAKHDYVDLGIHPNEVFISDGVQGDMGHFQELFASDSKIAIQDPTYPLYLDSNIMAGRTRTLLKTGRYGGVTYLPCTEDNGFIPSPPQSAVDLVYLCHPNNPTGTPFSREMFKKWIDYAKTHRAVLLIDGAYSAFITDPKIPRSIYEIEGAQEVAVEFRSFSKSAAFTGLRCSYAIVPHALRLFDFGATHSLHALWKRRQDTKFNGVAYPIQKAAEAVYSEQGKKEVRAQIRRYLEQAELLHHGLTTLGMTVYGGTNAPFLWVKTPPKTSSWELFDHLLHEQQIITVPGQGFGQKGEGFIRFSTFAKPGSLIEALARFQSNSSFLAGASG
ncbi:MAG: LL-diaminopimelate aminotransferase [Chlamydiia bacterium]|nr:LL-diaminopimelate aminotransferase [Chlamydiia bacterium]